MKSTDRCDREPRISGFAEDLQNEIELYSALAEKYENQARRRGIFALLFCLVSALGASAIAVIAILASAGVFGVRWFLLAAYLGLSLVCLLVGLLFFNGRHDSLDLAIESSIRADEKEAKLKKMLEDLRAEEEAAKKGAVHVVEVLPKIPASKTHKVANVLRATSSVLAAIYALAIPVASIAALCKSKPKKEKKEKKEK